MKGVGGGGEPGCHRLGEAERQTQVRSAQGVPLPKTDGICLIRETGLRGGIHTGCSGALVVGPGQSELFLDSFGHKKDCIFKRGILINYLNPILFLSSYLIFEEIRIDLFPSVAIGSTCFSPVPLLDARGEAASEILKAFVA